MKSDELLVIAGASKSGTTFLFDWLKTHPQINPCQIKEPRFFIPEEFTAVKSNIRYGREGLDQYLALFEDNPFKLKMEASANYFGFFGSEKLIAKCFPLARIVLVLREPVDRLLSCYQMAKTKCWIPDSFEFDDYVDHLIDDIPIDGVTRRYILDEGLYSKNLELWLNTFPREQIFIIWTDDLNEHNEKLYKDIEHFLQLDSFIPEIADLRRNASASVRESKIRKLYKKFKIQLQNKGGQWYKLVIFLDYLRNKFKLLINPLFLRKSKRIVANEDTIEKLFYYYRNDVLNMENASGLAPPWLQYYLSENKDNLMNNINKLEIKSS